MGAIAALVLFVFLIVLVLGICIGFLLARLFRKHLPPPAPPPPQPPPPPPPPGYKIPNQLGETDLTTHLTVRLAGTAANGVPISSDSSSPALSKVVWIDHGNEVLVHLDSTSVRILDRMVLVSVDLETDQTGRTPLVCSFAVSGQGELGGLVATTDELPQGSGMLASCWGQQLQSAVWSSLMGIVNDHAAERDLAPRALSASAGNLSLNAGGALTTLASTGGPA